MNLFMGNNIIHINNSNHKKKGDQYGFTVSKFDQKKIHDGKLRCDRIAIAFGRCRFDGCGKIR